MIKTHNKTKLNYLCKTSTNDIKKCFKYKGSGIFWKRHLLKYGTDITTKIIETCNSIEELREKAIYWSNYYNIVNSEKWANLVIENGSNVNDTSFQQMLKCRKASYLKACNTKEFRLKRKMCGIETSKRQKGLTMQQRMGKDWVDPRKGKTMKEIYKQGHKHPQIKPYKITLNDGEKEWFFDCESQIKQIGLYPYPTLGNLKKNGIIFIKRTKPNSRHNFKVGDKLAFQYI